MPLITHEMPLDLMLDPGHEINDYLYVLLHKLIEDESFDKYNLENIIAWWKNKASNRYETLSTEGRLRTELEVWTNNNNIDIIR